MSARFGTLEHYHAQGYDSKPATGTGRKRGSVPVQPAGKCWCGCGQAHYGTNKSRLLFCPQCGQKACRQSRAQMVAAPLACATCLVRLEPVCDEDAAIAGFEDRARELEARIADSQVAADTARGRVSDDREWWARRQRKRARRRLPNTPIQVGWQESEASGDDLPF